MAARPQPQKDARVMAWWDYGYQITGVAPLETIADVHHHHRMVRIYKCWASRRRARTGAPSTGGVPAGARGGAGREERLQADPRLRARRRGAGGVDLRNCERAIAQHRRSFSSYSSAAFPQRCSSRTLAGAARREMPELVTGARSHYRRRTSCARLIGGAGERRSSPTVPAGLAAARLTHPLGGAVKFSVCDDHRSGAD